jgi:hypothetical protein
MVFSSQEEILPTYRNYSNWLEALRNVGLSRSISCRTASGTRFVLSDQHLNIIGEQSPHTLLPKPPS